MSGCVYRVSCVECDWQRCCGDVIKANDLGARTDAKRENIVELKQIEHTTEAGT